MSGAVLRIPKKVFRRREVERLRDIIPVDTYFAILDHAIVTGKMPILDPQTRRPLRGPDGEFVTEAIDAKDRISLAKYLMDKRMPTIKSVAITDAGAKEEFEVDASIEAQSTEALRQLISPTGDDDSPNPLAAAGLHNPWDDEEHDVDAVSA